MKCSGGRSPGVLIFKLGHCKIQIRPLGIKVGQHRRPGTGPFSGASTAALQQGSLRTGPPQGVIHPISFGGGLFHFLLTRRRQHRGVTFSLGEGSRVQDESRHLAPVAAFLPTHHLIRRERWISG